MAADLIDRIGGECGIRSSLEVFGERWAFLILRGAFSGLEHFEDFQNSLGIARNILSDRLARLVEHEILAREPDPSDRRRVAYRLTERGRDLLPVMIALRDWGDTWACEHPATRMLVDRLSRRPIAPMKVRDAEGRILEYGDLIWADVPTAGTVSRAGSG